MRQTGPRRFESLTRSLPAAVLALALAAGASRAQEGAQAPAPVTQMPRLEAEIFAELNQARGDPLSYASYLEALVPQFQGMIRRTPHGLLRTNEGAPAVQEAADLFRRLLPIPVLRRSAGLSAAARDLVRDQGENGGMGHMGSDGSTTSDRAERHGAWGGSLTENVSYSGFAGVSGREVVMQLLVDDGVPSRGHRRNMLDPSMRLVGVACGTHQRYPVVCVMVHAREYTEGR